MSGFESDSPVEEEEGGPQSPTEPPVKRVKELADGFELIEPAIEVDMAKSAEAAEPIDSVKNEALWTWRVTACCTVATYDHATGKRTLVHLKGSDAGPSYYKALAKKISPTTTVIIASGTDTGSKIGFTSTVSDGIEEKIKEAMGSVKKDTSKLVFKLLYSTEKDDKAAKVQPGTFAITAKGKYGRVRAEEE